MTLFKNTKEKISRLPLHYKILMWFILFSIIMLTLLWTCQTVFLGTFYKVIRVRQIEDCASSIQDNINKTNTNITSMLENVAEQNDVSIYVYNTGESVLEPLYSTDKKYMKIISVEESPENAQKEDGKKSPRNEDNSESDKEGDIAGSKNILVFSEDGLIKGNSIYTYYQDAKEEGGSCITFIENNEDTENKNIYDSIHGNLPPMDKLNTESMVYTSLFTDNSDNDYMVILTSQISPVDSIVDTIRYQLSAVTGILIVIGIFLAILASQKISRPITETTKLAKRLANKEYDIKFNNTGYREVTELNKTLNYAAGELKKVDDLQRELIANISHDLRTPLTMITGYGEVMRDLPGENTPENIQIIIDEANRLNLLVTDLLDISKLQSGTTTLNREVFSLTELIRELFSRYNKLKEQEGYNFIFEYRENIEVNADLSKINQVVYNLINNAINYSGEDKTIIVRQIKRDGKVLVEVEDHGDGIDQEHLENIWDRYYKVDKEHRSSVVGTGLGLSIVKNVLDLHKARYGVRSVPRRGSVFWFELKIYSEN